MALFQKGGGGFLNGEDATIVGYKWETSEFDSKKTKGKKYSKLSFVVEIQRDGAEQTVPQFIDAGFFYPDSMSISDDGLTIESDRQLRDDTDFARFIGSLVEAGFEESELEAGGGLNFEMIVNRRYTFKREPDKVRQMAAGRNKLGAKAKDASEDEIMAAGRRKDKKDPKKSYNLDILLVAAVLGEAEPVKGAKKAAPKATAAKGGKPAATKKAAEPEVAGTDRADEVIVSILADAKDNKLPRAQVSSAVVRYALANEIESAEREALRKQLFDEAYLTDAAERGVITYDSKDKKQVIGLA